MSQDTNPATQPLIGRKGSKKKEKKETSSEDESTMPNVRIILLVNDMFYLNNSRKGFIIQLRKYPCNIAHDMYRYIFSFSFYIPRIFLEQKLI